MSRIDIREAVLLLKYETLEPAEVRPLSATLEESLKACDLGGQLWGLLNHGCRLVHPDSNSPGILNVLIDRLSDLNDNDSRVRMKTQTI